MLADIVLALTAGPLLAAGTAKAAAPADRIDWPLRSGPLRPPWGPRLTGAAETAAATAIVLVPGRTAAIVALLGYLALTAVALRLRGARCACFGVARLASVGRAHIGLNAGGALVAASALAAGPGSEPVARTAAGAVAAVVTLGAVLLADRRSRRDGDAACDRPITGVLMYLAEDCPSCRSLKQLLETVEPARREAVVMLPAVRGTPLPAPVAGLAVPCAVGVDDSGTPVCPPVEGIGAVKALVDGITVRNVRGTAGGEASRVA
ncbi:hypothetical protein Acsp03_42690 [Actinomadura sp. NBRC 104412]|uniref:hypothetical protein n=1 Tax=Actinomadura sp. NBRC 104412 TaxID=3032203 RepID=UPI0024A1814C|nr:hypothetical protein [Actinomadura sp. NBRC 104412]GLZ06803.1 hypothetical protein Acsp03_42690 [Actinomadura sp. NBRC 104412]